MLRGAGGCLAPWQGASCTPGPISSLRGTAGSPRSISSLTSFRDWTPPRRHQSCRRNLTTPPRNEMIRTAVRGATHEQ